MLGTFAVSWFGFAFLCWLALRQATILNSEVVPALMEIVYWSAVTVFFCRRTTALAFCCLQDVYVPCRRVFMLCSVRISFPVMEWKDARWSVISLHHAPRAITPVLAFLCHCA